MDVFLKLTKSTLFKGMIREEVKENLDKVKYQILNYSKGEVVAFRGDEIDGLYINLEGNLVSEMMKSSGVAKQINDIRKNIIIASALIFGKNKIFPVDLICRSYCKLFFISTEELLTLVSNDKRILRNMLEEVSDNAQFFSMKFWQNCNNKTISEKIIDYIIKNQKGGIITFKPSLKEVASLFDVARSSLSRALGEFTKKGILEKKGRSSFVILDIETLKSRLSN